MSERAGESGRERRAGQGRVGQTVRSGARRKREREREMRRRMVAKSEGLHSHKAGRRVSRLSWRPALLEVGCL